MSETYRQEDAGGSVSTPGEEVTFLTAFWHDFS